MNDMSLNEYMEMINKKANIFVTSGVAYDLKSETLGKSYCNYGTIEAITEELGEVAKADRILRSIDIAENSHDWSQDQVLEELGDLLFNISLFAYYRGISLEDIIEYNIRKVEARG